MPFPDKARIPYIAARPAFSYAAIVCRGGAPASPGAAVGSRYSNHRPPERHFAGAETSYGHRLERRPDTRSRPPGASHRYPTADPARTL